MSEHKAGIRGEILDMLQLMGDKADLDGAEDLEDYYEGLFDLSLEELYDVHSMTHGAYVRWLKTATEEEMNANST